MSDCIAKDGLLARDSGPWALDKLGHLSRYAGIMTSSMKGKWTKLAFADIMAGPGRCVDTRTTGRPEFDGSTLRALDPALPFTAVVAVEADSQCADALRSRVSQLPRSALCRVVEGDCNNSSAITMVRDTTQGALTLMFVDLLGTEVNMRTLRALTAGRRIDLMITWPVMDLTRNGGMMSDQPDRWNAFFGTNEWEQAIRRLGPSRRLVALQQIYVRQLEEMGYAHHSFIRGVRNRRGGVLYRQLFASKNPLGLKLWNAAVAAELRQTPRFDFD